MENLSFLADLGISTRENSTAELLDKFGLNWSVEKEPLLLPDGKPSGFFGVVRQDTRKVFTTCKEGYTPFQNSELADLVNRAAGKLGLEISAGGKFNEGGRVYLQLQTGILSGLGENRDSVKKFVTGINSHDGSTSLRWGLSNITISCQNSFWRAAREIGKQNKARHTVSIHNTVEGILRGIEGAQEQEKTLYETFFRLAEIPVGKQDIEKVVKTVLDIDLTKMGKDITSYQRNRLNELSGAINAEMRQKGQTRWGLFSGVTKYTTHIMPGGPENRAQSKAVGMGQNIDNNVLELLTA